MNEIAKKLAFALALAAAPACQAQASDTPAPIVFKVGAEGARVSACLGYSVGSAVNFFGHPLLGGVAPDVASCVRKAEDCDAVLGCLGYTIGECEEGCEEAVARHCRTLPSGVVVSWREDCSVDPAQNHECKLIIDEGKGNYSSCFDGTTCEAEGCASDAALHCDHGFTQRWGCAPNETCTMLGDATTCMAGGSCESDYCEDEQTIVRCNGGTIELRARCADVMPGTVCKLSSSMEATCAAEVPDPSCPTDNPFNDHCEGDVGIACVNGVRYEVDCSSVAAHCETADHTTRCNSAGAGNNDGP